MFQFPGLPPDGTPVELIHTVHVALTSLYYIVATVGLCCSAACLVFNITLRRRKYVRTLCTNGLLSQTKISVAISIDFVNVFLI